MLQLHLAKARLCRQPRPKRHYPDYSCSSNTIACELTSSGVPETPLVYLPSMPCLAIQQHLNLSSVRTQQNGSRFHHAASNCLRLCVQLDRMCYLCRRFTCSSRGAYCPLCERNTERRCEPSNNFAPKQVENRPLTTSCGAPIRVCLVGEHGMYPGLPSVLPTDRICFEVRTSYIHNKSCLRQLLNSAEVLPQSCHASPASLPASA